MTTKTQSKKTTTIGEFIRALILSGLDNKATAAKMAAKYGADYAMDGSKGYYAGWYRWRLRKEGLLAKSGKKAKAVKPAKKVAKKAAKKTAKPVKQPAKKSVKKPTKKSAQSVTKARVIIARPVVGSSSHAALH